MTDTFVAPTVHHLPADRHSAKRCETMTDPAEHHEECGKTATCYVLTASPYNDVARKVWACNEEHALKEAEGNWGIGSNFPS